MTTTGTEPDGEQAKGNDAQLEVRKRSRAQRWSAGGDVSALRYGQQFQPTISVEQALKMLLQPNGKSDDFIRAYSTLAQAASQPNQPNATQILSVLYRVRAHILMLRPDMGTQDVNDVASILTRKDLQPWTDADSRTLQDNYQRALSQMQSDEALSTNIRTALGETATTEHYQRQHHAP